MGAVPAAARVTVPPKPIEQSIPLASIVPSPTNPRRYFDEAKLAELAASILEKGVLQAILVRPRFDKGTKQSAKNHGISVPTSAYELVAGERRFRAAKLAGLAEIPARVVELTDREVLEIQVIENDQRSDVTDLERSDAYSRLITDHKVSVAEIAGRVGKSEATIRSVLKLQDLPEIARKALEAGTINSAVAQLVATRPSLKMRDQVAKYALAKQDDWDPDEQKHLKGLPSYRIVKDFVRQKLMVPLDQAPFDLAKRVGAHPDCETCPHRTGNNRADFPDGRPDVCTLPTCFAEKKDAWQKAEVEAGKRLGQKVLSTAEAKKVLPHRGLAYDSEFLDLAAKCYELKSRSYDALLRKHLDPADIVLGFDQAGDLHQLVPKKIANRILKEKHKLGVKKSEDREPTAAEMKDKEEIKKRKQKAEGRRRAALFAIRKVGEEAKTLGGTLGWSPALTGMLRELVASITSMLGSLVADKMAEARGISGDDAVERLEASVKSMTSARDLFTYLAQFVAADLSERWRHEYSQGPNDDEQRFFAAFSIDARKLCRQYEHLSDFEKPKPKEKKSSPAKVEFSVSEEDAELANLEVATVDAPSRSLSDIGVSIEKLRNSQLRPLFESRSPKQGPSTVRPFLADGTLWVAASGPPEWICLPLISQSLFEGQFPDRELRLEPSKQIEPETIYFGVRVNHEGLEWIIGPRSLGMLVSADEAKNAESTEKPYAWDVEIELHDGTKVRKAYVAPNEKQARRNAMLTSKAREITSIESMTEKQYHAVHGFGRRSMSTKTSHSS